MCVWKKGVCVCVCGGNTGWQTHTRTHSDLLPLLTHMQTRASGRTRARAPDDEQP